VLTRGNLIFLAPVAALFALTRWKAEGVKGIGIFILACLLPILPVTIHNAYVSHDFVPVTYAAGFNFYIGNRQGADGGSTYPADVGTGLEEEKSVVGKAEKTAGHPLKPSEVDHYWLKQGLDYIGTHPHQALSLYLRKIGLFFSNMEIPDNYNVDFFTRNFDTILKAPLPGFALVLGLSVFGFIACGRNNRARALPLLVLATVYMCSVLPFYVTDRYRLPVIVFLLPLAGLTAPALGNLVELRRWGRIAAAEALSIACVAGSLLYPSPTVTPEAIGWTGLSEIEFDLGRDLEGLSYLQKAIAISPRDVNSYFYMKGVAAEERRGNHDQALTLMHMAATLHPAEAASIEESYGRYMTARHPEQRPRFTD
jgi:hypothetical protein